MGKAWGEKREERHDIITIIMSEIKEKTNKCSESSQAQETLFLK